MSTTASPVEIASGIYWVGVNIAESGLHCNPYLIVADDEAALVDPGSPLDFPYVLQSVTSIMSLDKIRYIILQHQDPDLCASTPLFESNGVAATVISHWRTAQLVKYYGIQSPFLYVNQQNDTLQFKNGRVLRFIPTPYLHCPGSITTFDEQTCTLMSSDLFGAFTHNWTLYADELPSVQGKDLYLDAMRTFHEHYMPSSDILRPVMEKFLRMNIQLIAPQHGSVIRQNITQYIKELRTLACGNLLYPVKQELAQSYGLEPLCNEVLARLFATFPTEEVLDVFADTGITVKPDSETITDYVGSSQELWENLFRVIAAKKGWSWLTVIEPLTVKLSQEYGLEMPGAFAASLLTLQEEAQAMAEENRLLKSLNDRLEENLAKANDVLLKCPITGLYNQSVLLQYLQQELESAATTASTSALLLLSIDNMTQLNTRYGGHRGDDIIRAAAYTLGEMLAPTHRLFKAGGASFAYYIAVTTREKALAAAESLRAAIAGSRVIVEPITVSIGVSLADECSQTDSNKSDSLLKLAHNRMLLARKRGQNQVCIDIGADEIAQRRGKVLIADYEQANLDILRNALEEDHYEVITATDGSQAYRLINRHSPDIVITELMLPKMDALLLKEKISQSSATKDIPVILLAYHKDTASVQRAMALGIDRYLQKPYFLAEVLGIIRNKLRHTAAN